MKVLSNEKVIIKASKAAKQLKNSVVMNYKTNNLNQQDGSNSHLHSYQHGFVRDRSHQPFVSPQKYFQRNQRRKKSTISSEKKQQLNQSLKMLEICFKDFKNRHPQEKGSEKGNEKVNEKDNEKESLANQVFNYRHHQKYFSQGYIQRPQQPKRESSDKKHKQRFKRYRNGMDSSDVQRIIARGDNDDDKNVNQKSQQDFDFQKQFKTLSEVQQKKQMRNSQGHGHYWPPLPLSCQKKQYYVTGSSKKQGQIEAKESFSISLNSPNYNSVGGLSINKVKKIALTSPSFSHQRKETILNTLHSHIDKLRNGETTENFQKIDTAEKNVQSSHKRSYTGSKLQSSFCFLEEKFKLKSQNLKDQRKTIQISQKTESKYNQNDVQKQSIKNYHIGSLKNLKQKKSMKNSTQSQNCLSVAFQVTARFPRNIDNQRSSQTLYRRSTQSFQRKKSSQKQRSRQKSSKSKEKSSQASKQKRAIFPYRKSENNSNNKLQNIPQCSRQGQRVLKVKLPSKSHCFTKSNAEKIKKNDSEIQQKYAKALKQANLIKKCEKCLKPIGNSPKLKINANENHRIAKIQVKKDTKQKQKSKKTIPVQYLLVSAPQKSKNTQENQIFSNQEIDYEILMPVVNREMKADEKYHCIKNQNRNQIDQRYANIAEQVKKAVQIATSIKSMFSNNEKVNNLHFDCGNKANPFEKMEKQIQNEIKESKVNVNCHREMSLEIEDIIIRQIAAKRRDISNVY